MATAKPKIRSRWPLITKIAGLLLIVVFLVRNPEILLNAWRVLRGADPFYWATGLGLMVTSLWIAGWRTYYLLRLNGHRIAQSRLFVDILQATALNVVLIMGADVVYRAKRINDVVGNPAMAGTIVVFDRLIGFAVVLGGSIVAFAFFGDAGGGIRFNPKLLLLGVGALGLAILALRFLAPGRLRSLLRQVEPLLRHLTSPKHFLGLGAVSVAVFVTQVVSVGLLGKALGQTLGLGVYAYASSFVTIATLLPITIGGAGVREMGYVLLLGPHGVSQDSAIALGILQYSAFVGIALLGGGTVLLGRLGGPTEKPPVPPETPHSQAPPTPASPLPKAPPPTR